MKAEESIRYVQNADTAILFIHGILGTPDHFTPFLPFVPPNWSIYNMLLKGHGGGVKEFSSTSMIEWKQQVHTALQNLLASHDKVVIAAHSMGTLFAIQEAIDNQVDALFCSIHPSKFVLHIDYSTPHGRFFMGISDSMMNGRLLHTVHTELPMIRISCTTLDGFRDSLNCSQKSEKQEQLPIN